MAFPPGRNVPQIGVGVSDQFLEPGTFRGFEGKAEKAVGFVSGIGGESGVNGGKSDAATVVPPRVTPRRSGILTSEKGVARIVNIFEELGSGGSK